MNAVLKVFAPLVEGIKPESIDCEAYVPTDTVIFQQTHYDSLLQDRNLNPREIRSFMKKLHVRECVNAFSSLCDADENKNISETEWVACLFARKLEL